MTRRVLPDPAAFARDWVTMWQSEAASLAADREVQEGWERMAALWAAQMNATLKAASSALGNLDPAAGRPGAAAPAGSPPADAAPDAGELARLRGRVAELEQRLARLERER